MAEKSPRAEVIDKRLASLQLPVEPGHSMEQTITQNFLGEAPLGKVEVTADFPTSAQAASLPQERASLPALHLRPQSVDEEFEVLRTLGEGGMGIVQEAFQRSLKRRVALKRLKPSTSSERGKELLLQEARTTGVLEHPHIIPIHALEDDKGAPVMVMKRVDGVVWRELIHDPNHEVWTKWSRWSGAPLVRHMEVLMALCSALDFAHARGFLHRDIKPDNVMLGEFGEIYLLDWGIAIALPQGACAVDISNTSAFGKGRGKLAGTPAYFAPEMILGQPDSIDARSDVYLLGAVLFEILTGSPIHRGKTLHEICYGLFDDPVREYPADAPLELAEICARATARDPAKRFQSATAFRAAIEAFLEHRSSALLSQQSTESLAQLSQVLKEESLAKADNSSREEQRKQMSEMSDHIQRLFSETRFGFQIALRDWPNNPQAKDGLQRTIALLFERAIKSKDTSFASSLLQQYPEPPDTARAALAQLEQERDKAQQEEQALRKLAWELDLNFTWQTQRRLFWAMLALSLLTLGFHFTPMGQQQPTQLQMLILLLCFSVGTSTFLVLGRKSLSSNQISRQFASFVVASMLLVVCYRFVHFWLDTPVLQSMNGEFFLIGMACVSGGIFLRRWLLYAAAFMCVCGLLAAFWNDQTTFFTAVAYISIWIFALIFNKEHPSARH